MSALERLAELGRETEKTREWDKWTTGMEALGLTIHTLGDEICDAADDLVAALAERTASDLAGWARVRELEAELNAEGT